MEDPGAGRGAGVIEGISTVPSPLPAERNEPEQPKCWQCEASAWARLQICDCAESHAVQGGLSPRLKGVLFAVDVYVPAWDLDW